MKRWGVFVYVINRTSLRLGSVYSLSILYCALRTRVRCKRLINILLHYIIRCVLKVLQKLRFMLAERRPNCAPAHSSLETTQTHTLPL